MQQKAGWGPRNITILQPDLYGFVISEINSKIWQRIGFETYSVREVIVWGTLPSSDQFVARMKLPTTLVLNHVSQQVLILFHSS